MTIVAPSILSADFTALGSEVIRAVAGGAEYIHLDIMDGNFVPPISFGAGIVQSLRPLVKAVFDVHLMVDQPEEQIEAFVEAGADIITFHIETVKHPHRLVDTIKKTGRKCGIALNPGTSLSMIEELLPSVDMVLIMTVDPGYGGQKFIPGMLDKIARLRDIIDGNDFKTVIEVDGGINAETAQDAVSAGADILVAGSYIYGAADIEKAIGLLRGL